MTDARVTATCALAKPSLRLHSSSHGRTKQHERRKRPPAIPLAVSRRSLCRSKPCASRRFVRKGGMTRSQARAISPRGSLGWRGRRRGVLVMARRRRRAKRAVRRAVRRKVARKAVRRKVARKAVRRRVARKAVRRKVARKAVRRKVARKAVRRRVVRKAVARRAVRKAVLRRLAAAAAMEGQS